jgi:hypothetical protein
VNNSIASFPGRKPGRPCSVCINFDRKGIDQYIVQGRSYAEISRQFNVSAPSLMRHVRAGHLVSDIAAKSDRSIRLTMESVLDTVQDSISRAKDRITGTPGSDTTVPRNAIADQYYAPTERVVIEGSKLLSSVIVESTKIKLEQEKLAQNRDSSSLDYKGKVADYMRKYHADTLDRFLAEVGA